MKQELDLYHVALTIDGKATRFDSEVAIRWVEIPGSFAEPVLYWRGKRVVKPWTLNLVVDRPADPHGGNANTN